jgi:DNA polymerase-1
MLRLSGQLAVAGKKSRLLLQVHDELVLEVDRPDLDAVAAIVCETMEGAATLDVPLVVDVAAGQNWDELSPLEVAVTH